MKVVILAGGFGTRLEEETYLKPKPMVEIGGKRYSHRIPEKSINGKEEKYKTKPLVEYRCPITHEVMRDPVIAKDGFTYERYAIEKWFEKNNISPMKGCKTSKKLLQNNVLRTIVREWREENIILEDDNKDQPRNMLRLKINEPWDDLVYEYDDNSNVWDLTYEIYKVTKYTNNEYRLKMRYCIAMKTQLIKDVKDRIEIEFLKNDKNKIKIERKFSSWNTIN